MLCPKCNAEVAENAKFCSSCGAPVQLQEQNTANSQQQISNPQYQTTQPQRAIATNVDFGEAIKRLFTNFVEFNGRATRSEYWWSYLLSVLLSPFMLIPLIGTALTIALAIAMIACGIRRLHDAGYVGTYILLSFIPLVGGIIMIIFYAKESVPDNQWGPAAPGTVSKL